MDQQIVQQRLSQKLLDTLKTKKQLYEYLTMRLDWHLPIFRKCHVNFLVEILEDKKLVLTKKELRVNGINAHWSEYAVKNVWPQVKNQEVLQDYVPQAMLEDKYPDRDWFWSTVCTVLPVWAEKFKAAVVSSRRTLNKKQKLPDPERVIKISDKWLAALQAHDYESNIRVHKNAPNILFKHANRKQPTEPKKKIVVPQIDAELFNVPLKFQPGRIDSSFDVIQPQHKSPKKKNKKRNQISSSPVKNLDSYESVYEGSASKKGKKLKDDSFEVIEYENDEMNDHSQFRENQYVTPGVVYNKIDEEESKD